MTETLRLTQFSHGSGCGCKIAPAVLEDILRKSGRAGHFPGLLVGYESKDDAAVFRLDNGTCIVSTTDFFTPIVDDPYTFGRAAAANALSDVYAMGGKPVLAVAILGWPVGKLPADVAARVLEGGRQVCSDQGIPLAGGHSIDSPEPFFGLAVTGVVNEQDILRNDTAREGDVLLLTKPLGTGILAAAMKRGKLLPEHEEGLTGNLVSVNTAGAELPAVDGVHAVTDITGFGLLGHLVEMTEGSGLSAEIDYNALPLLAGTEAYAAQFIFPDNTYRNWHAVEKKVSGITGPAFITLCDPQTNGGLLIAADPASVPALREIIVRHRPGMPVEPVGKMVPRGAADVVVHENQMK
jgi:selenide,water dikinase